jgi:hypothetical protein
LEAVFTYAALGIIYYSYKRKNVRSAYVLIILLIIRLLLGFLNPPGDEVGQNRRGRLTLKWIAQATVSNYSIFLACQIY